LARKDRGRNACSTTFAGGLDDRMGKSSTEACTRKNEPKKVRFVYNGEKPSTTINRKREAASLSATSDGIQNKKHGERRLGTKKKREDLIPHEKRGKT